jgi:WD40-like Beta Propeller Repeat
LRLFNFWFKNTESQDIPQRIRLLNSRRLPLEIKGKPLNSLFWYHFGTDIQWMKRPAFVRKLIPAILLFAQITGFASYVKAQGAHIPGQRDNSRSQDLKPELFAPGVISGPVDDASPAFTPDGKTVYFYRGGSALGRVILVSHWQNGKWSTPVIAPFSGQWRDIEPAMAPDGSYMIFASNRPATPGGKALNGFYSSRLVPLGGGNLWRADREGNSWGEPYRLPDIINSDSSVFAPAITADGSLYFMKPVADTGRFHIYRSAYRNGRYEPPLLVSFTIGDSISDVDPAVSPDDSFLIFGSGRSKIKGQLFIVFRENGDWGIPINLGEEVNRATGGIEPRLSPNHRTLYYSSSDTQAVTYPVDPKEAKQRLAASEWDTGANNIWSVPLDKWLDTHK